jgi:diguanylate cyclase (GGDEF)-like protein
MGAKLNKPLPSVIDSEYWQTIFDLIPFPIYVADVATYEVIAANLAMRKRMAGALGKPCHLAIYQSDDPCSFCRIPELTQAGCGGGEIIFEHFNEADDHWYQLQEKLIAWFDGRTAKYAIAVDISTLKKVQNELAEAHAQISLQNIELKMTSVTDSLTGLFNRHKLDATFLSEVERSVRYGQSLSVVMVDIDNFKRVNDVHGHQVGDMVLTSIANILRQSVRKTDTIGRWGGEEFMVICPNTDLDGAIVIAEHMRQSMQLHDFAMIGQVTGSFGVAQLEVGESVTVLLARTDAALYRAKTDGRNRVEADRR